MTSKEFLRLVQREQDWMVGRESDLWQAVREEEVHEEEEEVDEADKRDKHILVKPERGEEGRRHRSETPQSSIRYSTKVCHVGPFRICVQATNVDH